MELFFLSNQLSFYITWLTMPIGVCLNILSAYIFLRPSLNKTNMGFLNFIKCLVDSIICLSNLLVFRSSVTLGYSVYNYYDLTCRILTFYRRILIHLSAAITAFITFDRYVSVVYSNGVLFMKSWKRILSILSIISLILSALNIINFFNYLDDREIAKNLTQANSTLVLLSIIHVTTCKSTNEILAASDIISACLRTYIPIVLMMFFNISIVRYMFKSKAKLNLKIHKREIQFTMTVLLSNIIFFIMNAPLAIAFILNIIYSYSDIEVDRNFKAGFDFYYNLAVNFSYMYQAFDFFLNLIVNSIFRNELFLLIGALIRKSSSLLQLLIFLHVRRSRVGFITSKT
jgi:hypothetical protein